MVEGRRWGGRKKEGSEREEKEKLDRSSVILLTF